jgi:EamA domain-containing membrane protein RarD
LGNWMVYVLGISGVYGVLLQQIALQTGRLAPAMATGSLANPLVGVLLGIVLLEERLAPPTWHKLAAFVARGCAPAAAVAISLSEQRERQSGPSARKRRFGEKGADAPGRLRPARDAPA